MLLPPSTGCPYLGLGVLVVGVAAESLKGEGRVPPAAGWGRGAVSPKAGVGGLWGHLGHFVTPDVQVTSLSLRFPLYKISLISQSCCGGEGDGSWRPPPLLTPCDLGPLSLSRGAHCSTCTGNPTSPAQAAAAQGGGLPGYWGRSRSPLHGEPRQAVSAPTSPLPSSQRPGRQGSAGLSQSRTPRPGRPP